jgi:sarcosine oxidase subunit gamma
MVAFPAGEIRRTRLAQIAAAFWMPQEGTVELVCFRSVAQYAFDLLTQAAAGPRVF